MAREAMSRELRGRAGRFLAMVSACGAFLLPLPLPAQALPAGVPLPGSLTPYRIPSYSETRLPNGLTVVMAEDNRFPLVTVRLVVGGGARRDPKATPGVAAALAAMLLEGTGSRSARQFAEDLDGTGGTMTATAHADSLTVEGSATSEGAVGLFALLSDIVRDAMLPETELDRYRNTRRQALLSEAAQPGAVAMRILRGALFGNAGYGAPEPGPHTMDSIDRQALIDYHNTWLRPDNAYLVLVGRLPPRAELDKILTLLFGAWPKQQPPAPAQPAYAQAGRKLFLVDRPGMRQAQIVVGTLAPPFADPETLPLVLASDVLGSAPGSRLALDFRDVLQQGEGIRTEMVGLADAGYISTIARARSALAGDVVAKILSELDRMGTAAVDAGALAEAKASEDGSFLFGMESQQGLADGLGRMKLLHLPKDDLETYTSRIDAVSAAQLAAAARKWMSPDHAVVVVVGDAAQIRGPLERIGPVELVGADGTPAPAKP